MLIEIYNVVDTEKNNNAFNPDFRTFFDTDNFCIVTKDLAGDVIGTSSIGVNVVENVTADPNQTQADATPLLRSLNIVRNAVANGDAVLLPSDYPLNIPLAVTNLTVYSLNVFPHLGASINAGAINAPTAISANFSSSFMRISDTEWIILSLV